MRANRSRAFKEQDRDDDEDLDLGELEHAVAQYTRELDAKERAMGPRLQRVIKSLYKVSKRIEHAASTDTAVRHNWFRTFKEFDADASFEVWRRDVSLFGDGNGCFEMYTDARENVAVDGGALRIAPGLFAEQGALQTGVPGVAYDAADVMLGACEPFPECATFTIPAERCTIPGFSGCERIGTPLVALTPGS